MNQIAIDILSNSETQRESVFWDKIPETAEGKVFYQCKIHDYVYVPVNFEDADGVRRRAGYYDETGVYYEQLRILEEGEKESFICKYCGHVIDLSVDTETLKNMKCPNCDASLNYSEWKGDGNSSNMVSVREIHQPKPEAKYKDWFRERTPEERRRAWKEEWKRDWKERPMKNIFLVFIIAWEVSAFVIPALLFIYFVISGMKK